MHNGTYQQGCHQRAFAHPVEPTHEAQRKEAGHDEQRNVQPQLRVAKIGLEAPRDGPHQVFARHQGDVGLYLEGNAQRQYDAAYQQVNHLCGVGQGREPVEQVHGKVDARAKEQRDGNLQEEHPQVAPQLRTGHQRQFYQEEQEVEDDGPLTHGEGSEHTGHVSDAGDGRRAQRSFRDVGDAHSVDEESEGKQKVAPDKVFFVIHII